MKRNTLISLLVIALLLALVGGVFAQGQTPLSSISSPASPQAALGTAFTYQGQLRNNGNPVNANCDFQFALYDTVSGGNPIGTAQIALFNIPVTNGLFTAVLDFGNVFTGDARWLDIAVRCPAGSGNFMALTPRQSLTAVPYALGLLAGAVISGTGRTALWVINSGADGISGRTDGTSYAGVYGYNTSSTGAGVSGESNAGVGSYGRSNTGIGVWGTSSTGTGVSGVSGNVGVYAHNTNTNGPTAYLGSRCCAGDFYGDVYVHGNLTVTGSKSGYIVDLAVNAGSDTLSTGDVVAVVGNATPVIGNIPIARVVKASVAYQTGVIGVVDQHITHGGSLTAKDEPAAPGEYVNIVTLGMFHAIKADAAFGAIHAGDLLVASPHAGYAMKATDRAQASGAIIGKALGDLNTGTGTVPVIVTLQ